MKKIFGLIVACVLMVGGVFANKAEAVRHYHHQGADGRDNSVLIFSEDFAYDEGFIMGVHYTGPETKLAYLGKWHREPDGYIGVKYDLLKVMEANNNVIQERYVDVEMKLLKNNNSLRVITPDAPDNSTGNIYNMHEYVWGNDNIMASYMLAKSLYNGKAFYETIQEVPSLATNLNSKDLEMLKQKRQSPAGEGTWFRVTGDAMGTYYVESDPMAVYRREGFYLNLMVDENPDPVHMERRASAIDLGNHRARVIMYKDRTTEYYDIYFTPNYFVVEKAFADDPAVTKELQAEIGVRQEYGPNPRVNEVKEKLRCDL